MAARSRFLRMSETAVFLAGHRVTLAGVMAGAVAWCAVGLATGLPSGWFLSSNLVGTAVTLFLLLLMQHSQNRDMHALQTKVDELIRSNESAGNHWIGAHRREIHEIEKMVQDRQIHS